MNNKIIILISIFVMFIIVITGCTKENPQIKQTENWNKTIEKLCVERLKQSLRDPDSYQSISWNEHNSPIFTVNGWDSTNWEFVHTYRAKNGFGGYNVDNITFNVDSGTYNIFGSEDSYKR